MTDKNLLQSKAIPSLYISNLSNYTINTIPATYANWSYGEADGASSNEISSQNFDQLSNIAPTLTRIDISALEKQVNIRFSHTPISYTVYCWPEALTGFRKIYYNDSSRQLLEVIDNAITLPIEDPSYIVQIHAFWDQGEATYAFSISELVDDTQA